MANFHLVGRGFGQTGKSHLVILRGYGSITMVSDGVRISTTSKEVETTEQVNMDLATNVSS